MDFDISFTPSHNINKRLRFCLDIYQATAKPAGLGVFSLSCIFFILSFSRPLLASEQPHPELESLIKNIQKWDQEFKELSSSVYDHYQQKKPAKKLQDIRELERQVKRLTAKNDHFNAIRLIKGNQQAIENTIDAASVFYFLSLLLQHNEWQTALTVHQAITAYGDNFSISKAGFIFANYFFEKQQWQKTLQNLNGDFSNLTSDNAHYALLMKGASLQRLKNHRKAIQYYQQIPPTSPFYAHAQLNIAIAYIRQGWWSDARLVINALTSPATSSNSTPAPFAVSENLVNRSYVVLAYALFQQEYFRDSREVFRNVALDSPYLNRALLGIGLTSSSQEDFLGALNAFSLLKEKNSKDLTVDEAYLLQAFIYEKLNQHVTATAMYTEAIDYYQSRIEQIKTALINNNQQILLKNNGIVFTEHFPNYFLNNLAEVNYLSSKVDEQLLQNKVQTLQKKYAALHHRLIRYLLDQRLSYLNNYLNQSRYGLARLYDQSLLKN